MSGLDWHTGERATRLLCEFDAAERASDRYAGLGWSAVAEAFGHQAQEIEGELDNLRIECLRDFADAASDNRHCDAWLDSWDEADDEAVSVKEACDLARKLRWGDGLLELAA